MKGSPQMGVELLARGRRDMKPLLLKVGVALFLSFAGFLYAHLTSRGDSRGPRRGTPRPLASSDGGAEGDKKVGGGLKDERDHTQREEAALNVRSGTSVAEVASPTVGLSPSSRNLGDEGYLLPEFNEMVLREFESFGWVPDILEIPDTNRSSQVKEKVAEQEAVKLRNLVQLLQERVAHLEIQLLEYYGLKEQESTVRELENHLKVSTMEARLLSLKVESLQTENQRLGAQLSEYSRIKAELESARAIIKHLEGKLESDSVRANEKVAALHHRIASLQDGGCRDEEEDEEAEKSLKHLKDESAELRRDNSKLALENSDLETLSTQLLACSVVVESTEATKALEEASHLRQTNDELKKELAQLQIDHCADVEELVYLRWVNACLRYELRNHQPAEGKTLARDLSKTLSPRSEQMAKQLILEYANSGTEERSLNLMDFDSECCSSSQASSLTENGEVDDSLLDTSTATKNSSSSKMKFLKKLKRLFLGKDAHHKRISSVDRGPTISGILERRASVSACSFDDIADRNSYDSGASCITLDNTSSNQLMAVEGKLHEHRQNEAPWTRNLSRVSLDFQRLRSRGEFGKKKRERSKSDIGASSWHTVDIQEESLLGSPYSARPDEEIFDLPGKVETTIYTHAPNSPQGKPRLRTRAASCSLY